MKILITGADGFIGSYLKNRLKNSNHLTSPSRSNCDFANKNDVDNVFLDQYYDAVIHCAVEGRYTPMAINDTILATNLAMFKNLSRYKDRFGKFINIGTGAEFGLTNNISNAREPEILNVDPKESYGLSKNWIAREILELNNFYTLRLFGIFDSSEPEARLLSGLDKKIKNNEVFELSNDRYCDYVSAEDFYMVITTVLRDEINYKDINCVYDKKFKLSDICNLYCDSKNYDKSLVVIKSQTNNHYTGNSFRLNSLNLPLKGLEESLKLYNR